MIQAKVNEQRICILTPDDFEALQAGRDLVTADGATLLMFSPSPRALAPQVQELVTSGKATFPAVKALVNVSHARPEAR